MHDLGGRQGFGSVVVEPGDPRYHARWEVATRLLFRVVLAPDDAHQQRPGAGSNKIRSLRFQGMAALASTQMGSVDTAWCRPPRTAGISLRWATCGTRVLRLGGQGKHGVRQALRRR